MLVLVKVTSLCNLSCSYCYVYKTGYKNSLACQPAFINESTIISIAKQLNEIKKFCDNLVVCLHGGEPLLIGFKRLEFILKTLNEVLPGSLTLQTNATLITKEILDLLYAHNCLIGISLDGEEETHNKNRKYKSGKGGFADSTRGLELILSHPMKANGFPIINWCNRPRI